MRIGSSRLFLPLLFIDWVLSTNCIISRGFISPPFLFTCKSVLRKKCVVVVQLLSCVWPFVTPWTATHQAAPSFTVSHSLLKLMSIESVIPSSHLILCRLLLLLPSIFPGIRVFSNEWLFAWGGQSIGASASASVLPMNSQGWFPFRIDCFDLLAVNGLSKSSDQWGKSCKLEHS